MEFDGKRWNPYQPDFAVNVVQPPSKQLEGFGRVDFVWQERAGVFSSFVQFTHGANSDEQALFVG